MKARRLALVLFVTGCTASGTWNGLQCVSSTSVDPMESQPRFDPYEPTTFFADGRSMRAPPPGAVARDVHPRGPVPLGYETGALGGQPLARIPIALSHEMLAKGKERFEITCAACHGVLGDADTAVASKMSLRPPPSLLKDSIRAFLPGQIFQVITEGYGMMAPYRQELSTDERWAVVGYVRALQLSQRAPLAAAPPEVRDELLGEGRHDGRAAV